MAAAIRQGLLQIRAPWKQVASICTTRKYSSVNGSGYEGIWYNELRSRMNITRAENGQLEGTYVSLVGDAEYEYAMVGRYDTEGRSLGWTVAWNNSENGSSNSTTTWSGQYQPTEGNIIHTTWLLTEGTTPEEEWNSTNVGSDIFFKDLPNAEVHQRALKSGRSSHPKPPKSN